MGIALRGDKWSARHISRLKSYAESVERPNVSGLAKALGVSRQCIYDWALSHQNFRMALNDMRHGAINRIHVSAEDFMDDIDIMEMERKATPPKPKKKPKEVKVVEEVIEYKDELGNDEDWVIDD